MGDFGTETDQMVRLNFGGKKVIDFRILAGVTKTPVFEDKSCGNTCVCIIVFSHCASIYTGEVLKSTPLVLTFCVRLFFCIGQRLKGRTVHQTKNAHWAGMQQRRAHWWEISPWGRAMDPYHATFARHRSQSAW
jgi:hypothetical protein